MKNSTLQRAVSLACVLSICFIVHYVMAIENSPETNNRYLSVRKSLLPMFATRLLANEFFPFNRINPDIRPYILFYLEKDNYNYHIAAKGIWLLGFVGQADDIKFVDRYIQSRLNSLNEAETFRRLPNVVAGASGCFAGMMIKREIQGAERFFRKYAEVTAWMPPEDGPEAIEDARSRYSDFIMGAYQYSKADFILPLLQQKSSGPRPFPHESFIDAFEKMEIDQYTKLMKPSPTSEEKLNENITKFLDNYGEMIDLLLRKQTYAQWREAQEKQKAVPKVEKKPVDSFESIDMSETNEGGYLKAIASDAAKAYVQISRMLLDRNAKDLPIKKEILQDIQKAGLNKYDGFQVMVDVEAKINDFVPTVKSGEGKDEGSDAEPVVVKEKETAAVTFNIKGTADIFKRHFPDAGDNSLISSTTGNVIINMKRIDDKWYWGSASDPNVSAVADIVEDKYLIDSVSEAIIAYIQITRMIIDGNYDPLVIPVLDDGKLIPLKKREKDRDEMAKALDLEKRILEDLTKAKLNNYGDYHVKVKFEATLGNGGIHVETGIMPLTVKGYETADVTFMIRDGTEVFKKHAPARSDYDGAEGSGDLQVYMKRINGKWYWNPFGW